MPNKRFGVIDQVNVGFFNSTNMTSLVAIATSHLFFGHHCHHHHGHPSL